MEHQNRPINKSRLKLIQEMEKEKNQIHYLCSSKKMNMEQGELSVKENIIEIINNCVAIGDRIILSDVNLEIKKGDFIYILGRTGSGKSSLLKILYADIPAQGEISKIINTDLLTIRNRDIPSLRKKIGMVFQDFQLLTDRNVYENLEFVLRATGWKKDALIRPKIEDALSLVGLSDKKDHFPHQLSGGEQQKVVIARAMLNDPQVILADEPTGNLDPASSEEVMELLMGLQSLGKTILMCTHDMLVVQKFPFQVYRCIDGTLVKD